MNESQNRFPGKNLASHAGVFREARFSSFKSSWEARKNLACVLRLLVFRHSGNRHVKWDHRSVFRCCTGCGCICSLPVLACLLAYFERTRTKTIVNKREGRTEFNTKFEILYLDFSVDVANNFSASLCTDIRGRRYTGLRVPVMSSKIRQKCDLSTPFQLSEEKQTKIIYRIVYRNTINVSDFTDSLCKDIS